MEQTSAISHGKAPSLQGTPLGLSLAVEHNKVF